MSDDRLKEELALQLLGWKVAPDRFLKSGRSWIPKWRFNPLEKLDDAFLLLDHTRLSRYAISKSADDGFHVEIEIDGKIGKAVGEPKSRTITLALARSLGLEV